MTSIGTHPVRILSVFGTRPEAIKMAPVVRALSGLPGITASVCLTGQHRDLLAQATDLFGLRADVNLDVMRPGQGPGGVTAAVMTRMEPVLANLRPRAVLVHGDTATTLGAAMAAFYAGVPVAHVEAGLRTHDLSAPWPEEMNRRLVGGLADLHFAPTVRAAANLVAENVDEARIHVTGNTAIDALLWVRRSVLTRAGVERSMRTAFPWADQGRRLILVTGHRRENLGAGLDGLCAALARLADRGDVTIVWPLHPNPDVREPVAARLGAHPAIKLIEPLDYAPFVWLMGRAHLIITDSGGIQEEAPALGIPCLVTRAATERPEAVHAGTARLVGTDPDQVIAAAQALLDDPAAHQAMACAANPFGDGRAAERIAAQIAQSYAGASPVSPPSVQMPQLVAEAAV